MMETRPGSRMKHYQVRKGKTGKKTMQTEMESIKIKKVRELIELTENRKVIAS